MPDHGDHDAAISAFTLAGIRKGARNEWSKGEGNWLTGCLAGEADNWRNVDSAAFYARRKSPEWLAGYVKCHGRPVVDAWHNSDVGKTTREFWTATPGRAQWMGCFLGGVNAITPVGGGDVNDLPASMQQRAGMCQFVVGGATLGVMIVEQGPGALQKLKDASKAFSREPGLAAVTADGRTVAMAGEEVSAAEQTPSVFKATGRGSGGQPPAASRGGRASADAATSKPGRAPWRITKEGTERVVEHPRFGKFYKSKSDGLWWSKDRAGHGSQGRPQWKVFEETADGLKWKADADEFGDFIADKHKGPVGLQVPWSEVGGR